MVDDPEFWSGDRNRAPGSGSRVRGWCRSGRGTVVAVWGSGFEVFVESSGPVLVEAHVAANVTPRGGWRTRLACTS